MKDRVSVALVCLHISSAIYLLVGLGCLWASSLPEVREELPAGFSPFLFGLCIALLVGIEVVAWGLRRRQFWAWVAGLCIFGLYVPSLFLPLGGLGLWGLLASGSRAAFGVGPRPDAA